MSILDDITPRRRAYLDAQAPQRFPAAGAARAAIEARLGRPLGPIATMPKDLRLALKLLAQEQARLRRTLEC